MDKRVWWVIAVIALVVILFFVFKPTGNVILEEGALNETNESEGIGDLTPGEISACGNMASAGTYVLASDLSAGDLNGSSCFNVNANDVILNCAGKSVSGSNGVGVNAVGMNGVLQDCTINIENGEAIAVGENGSLSVKKSMVVSVKDQNGTNVTGASVSVSVGEGNDTISVSGITDAGRVSLMVVDYSRIGANTVDYNNYTALVSMAGFNGTSILSEGIANAEAVITDIAAPVVALKGTPTTTASSATIEYNVSENGILALCAAYVGSIRKVDTSAVKGSNSVQVTGLEDDTDYSAYVTCSDSAGFSAQSSSVSIKTSKKSSSSSNSTNTTTAKTTTAKTTSAAPTSTAGLFNMTYSVSTTQLDNGYVKALKLNEQIRLVLAGKVYLLQVSAISKDSASITPLSGAGAVIGAPIVLKAGGSDKVDFDGDKNYDIAVILKSLSSNSAEIVLAKMSGAVVEKPVEVNAAESEQLKSAPLTGSAVEGEEGGSSLFMAIIVILIIAIIVLAVIVVIKWVQVKKFVVDKWGDKFGLKEESE